MPPATSTRENALANIKTALEAVALGSSYNYTIDAVHRVDGPFFAYLSFFEGEQTVAFIEEGQTSWTPDTHDGKWLATLEVFVDVARRFEPDAELATDQAGEVKSTVRSKLIADAVRALLADNIRGGHAKRGFLLTDDGPVNLDELGEDDDGNPVWLNAGWVCHELRFEMAMEIDEAAP